MKDSQMSNPLFRPFLTGASLCLLAGVIAFAPLANAQGPVSLNPVPTRVVGHAKRELLTANPNLVEGKELLQPQGVALDTSVTPPILYVADTGNNRILAWKNARAASGSRADLVIGQRDFFSTFAAGPGSSFSSGLASPSSVAVDRSGNLFVYDVGNNRILRYAKPFSQANDLVQPDLVIGQTGLSASTPNQNLPSPTERTLATRINTTLYRARIAFDSSGNLWVVDAGNNRVLRYPASLIGAGAVNAPSADIVLGQTDFNSREVLVVTTANDNLNKNRFAAPPAALTFDVDGRLYVTDARRVIVYAPPFRTGAEGVRVLGLYANPAGQNKPSINEFTVGDPEGLFVYNNSLFVLDYQDHRIMKFEPFDQWQPESTLLPSPAAKSVYGQPDLLSFKPNRDLKLPSASSYLQPADAAVFQNELWLADSGNNRVLSIPLSGGYVLDASRVLGQNAFSQNSPNFVEGKELFLAIGTFTLPNNGGGATLSAGIVTDQTSNPPRLYIADTYNNRVLAYADARKVKPGDTADLVIGQSDFFTTAPNSPAYDVNQPTDSGMVQPVGLAVDASGNLWVADSGNGRAIRFPNPFEAQRQGRQQRATIVLGQSGFNFKVQDVTRSNMGRPLGVALTSEGHLVVSDATFHRVLLFKRAVGGDFSSGMNATTVIGQRDFNTATISTTDDKFNSPHHVAMDTDDRLYVADTGNNRIAIFDRVLSIANGATSIFGISFLTAGDRIRNPQGIWVSSTTGEIWVADTPNGRVVRFPKFDTLIIKPVANYAIGNQTQPLAVTLDPLGNLLIADSANRVTMHFPSVSAVSAASYLPKPLSPGLIAAMFPSGVRFTEQTISKSTDILPKELADIEVLVDDKAAPLYFVSPTQINFYVPMSSPTSGTSEFIVQKKSIGQVLASGILAMGPATPSFFTTSQTGQGAIAALNEDNTLNTPANRIARKGIIQLFGTGAGFIPNAPADGVPASATTLISTPLKPRVIVNTDELAQEDILFSGLAPNFVGLWQLNIRIPDKVAPDPAVPVAVLFGGVASTSGIPGFTTSIAVKQ